MLTIYGVPVSVHTRKAIVAAILKGAEYRVEPVVPFNPPAGWRALSPTGLIPAISDDGYELSDSAAICAYLDRALPGPSLYPSGAQALGQALWLEQWAATVLFRQVIHPLFFQKVIRPHILNEGAPDEAVIRRVQAEEAPQALGYLEARLAGAHLVGDGLTIADIAVISNLVNYSYLGFRVDPQRFPKLASAFAAGLAGPGFARALAAEAPFAAQMGLDGSFLPARA